MGLHSAVVASPTGHQESRVELHMSSSPSCRPGCLKLANGTTTTFILKSCGSPSVKSVLVKTVPGDTMAEILQRKRFRDPDDMWKTCPRWDVSFPPHLLYLQEGYPENYCMPQPELDPE
ncbi:uncharacterized protein LOC144877289 [Branchiostoma floridae x Branchiostoma japonicum]